MGVNPFVLSEWTVSVIFPATDSIPNVTAHRAKFWSGMMRLLPDSEQFGEAAGFLPDQSRAILRLSSGRVKRNLGPVLSDTGTAPETFDALQHEAAFTAYSRPDRKNLTMLRF
ncbi:hypothetical protein [Bradyrhizobium sp. C9]|uniref:hypothetical protein n=1 Tax=Bradyrhizobium sp. C9 TaxID=142585 RepID=UPI0018E99AA0|nr:hypothetical protein [Bradyrhizobium sp. C9]